MLGKVKSDIGIRSGTSHVGDTENFYNATESGSERDDSTILESDDALSNASARVSEGVQAATCDARSSAPVVGNSSCENATSIGMQDENTDDVTVLPPLDLPITDAANTHTTVYSDVKMLCAVNKWPNSAITIALRDIAGETDEVEF
eukprot:11812859-Ditylum_brightwellii.AAC.1